MLKLTAYDLNGFRVWTFLSAEGEDISPYAPCGTLDEVAAWLTELAAVGYDVTGCAEQIAEARGV